MVVYFVLFLLYFETSMGMCRLSPLHHFVKVLLLFKNGGERQSDNLTTTLSNVCRCCTFQVEVFVVFGFGLFFVVRASDPISFKHISF